MKCLASVPDDDGYENSIGETLCDGCFVELWGHKIKAAPTIEEWALNALEQTRSAAA